MTFKLNNTRNEDSRRIAEDEIASSSIEVITTAATLNPYVPTTQLIANSSSYSLTLPNAEPGTIKIITIISNAETYVTVNYKGGYDNDDRSNTFSRVGDLVIYYASTNGWHTRTFIWD